MNTQEVLKFINENPVCYIASAQNNIPSVRIMRILEANENGIMFNTKKYKKSFMEMSENPNIEMCFYNSKKDIQIRVFGKVEEIEDLTVKQNIVCNYPKLNHIVAKRGYEAIVPFILRKWQVKHCTRH